MITRAEAIKSLAPESQFVIVGDELTWVVEPNEPITEQMISDYIALHSLEAALDAHIDSVAQSYRYESIRTMATYATSEHPKFGAEGRAAIKWRDACYDKAYKIQADVVAGLRQIPSEAELIAEMPPITDYL